MKMKNWTDFWGMMFISCFLRLISVQFGIVEKLGDAFIIVALGATLFDAGLFYILCRIISYRENLLQQKESLLRGLEDLAAGRITAVDIKKIMKDAE